MENVVIALEIMGKGMAGIFAAILIITAIVWLMGKAAKKCNTHNIGRP